MAAPPAAGRAEAPDALAVQVLVQRDEEGRQPHPDPEHGVGEVERRPSLLLPDLGFGRIVASEIEVLNVAPNMLVNMA